MSEHDLVWEPIELISTDRLMAELMRRCQDVLIVRGSRDGVVVDYDGTHYAGIGLATTAIECLQRRCAAVAFMQEDEIVEIDYADEDDDDDDEGEEWKRGG